MAEIKEYKINNVANLKERLDGARAIILVDYKGITVAEVNKLRNELRTNKVDYFVSKNTWIKIALNQLGINALDEYLKGSTAVMVSKNDEVAPAKVLKKFAETELEKKEYCTFKVGLVSGEIFNPAQLKQLADLPSKEELIAKILYGFNAPITGLVSTLNGIIRKLPLAINAIAEQKSQKN